MLLAGLLVALAAACPPNLANALAEQPRAAQLVTVEAAAARTSYASLRIWRRSRGCWVAAGGPFPARVGWNGIAAERHEGDGTTPAGTFRIGATMYGNEPDPGVRFRYRRLACGDWWVEDAASPAYNTFRHVRCGSTPPFRVSGNGMWQDTTAYPYLAVVEFNMGPVVPGRGSGIFLHAQTGRPTNGCVSLRKPDLRRVLRWLRPAASPRIAIGTSAQLRR